MLPAWNSRSTQQVQLPEFGGVECGVSKPSPKNIPNPYCMWINTLPLDQESAVRGGAARASRPRSVPRPWLAAGPAPGAAEGRGGVQGPGEQQGTEAEGTFSPFPVPPGVPPLGVPGAGDAGSRGSNKTRSWGSARRPSQDATAVPVERGCSIPGSGETRRGNLFSRPSSPCGTPPRYPERGDAESWGVVRH